MGCGARLPSTMRPVPAHPASTDDSGHNPGAVHLEPGHTAPLVTDLSLDDLERDARHAIGEMAYAYYSGGAEDERLLEGNIDSLGPLAAPSPGTGGNRHGVHRHHPAGHTGFFAGRDRPHGDPGTGPSRRRGGDRTRSGGGGRTHDPLLAGHLPTRRGGGRGPRRAPLDAGLRAAGPGPDRGAGRPRRGAPLRRPRSHRRRCRSRASGSENGAPESTCPTTSPCPTWPAPARRTHARAASWPSSHASSSRR